MKAVGYLLGACLILAALKALAAAIALGLVLALVIGALTRPKETLALMTFMLLSSLVKAAPVASVISITSLIAITLAAPRRDG